jgi:hypothetical protein
VSHREEVAVSWTNVWLSGQTWPVTGLDNVLKESSAQLLTCLRALRALTLLIDIDNPEPTYPGLIQKNCEKTNTDVCICYAVYWYFSVMTEG